METLPKDIKIEVALNLNPVDLINLCSTNKEYKEIICGSHSFWSRKLLKDYPEIYNYFVKNNLVLKNPKNTYLRKFNSIWKTIEDFFYGSSLSSINMDDEAYSFYVLNKKEIGKKVYDMYNKFLREGKILKEGDDDIVELELNKLKGDKTIEKILNTSLKRYFITLVLRLFRHRAEIKF